MSRHWHAAPESGSVSFRPNVMADGMDLDEEDCDDAECDDDDLFALYVLD
jgi:hypothetical protein